jgi:hypothetical protein
MLSPSNPTAFLLGVFTAFSNRRKYYNQPMAYFHFGNAMPGASARSASANGAL